MTCQVTSIETNGIIREIRVVENALKPMYSFGKFIVEIKNSLMGFVYRVI